MEMMVYTPLMKKKKESIYTKMCFSFLASRKVFASWRKASPMAECCLETKAVCLYRRDRGRVSSSHQAAVIRKARVIAVPMEMPIISEQSTSARQITKGMTEPM